MAQETAMIVGAGQGLGTALVDAFAGAGYTVLAAATAETYLAVT